MSSQGRSWVKPWLERPVVWRHGRGHLGGLPQHGGSAHFPEPSALVEVSYSSLLGDHISPGWETLQKPFPARQ